MNIEVTDMPQHDPIKEFLKSNCNDCTKRSECHYGLLYKKKSIELCQEFGLFSPIKGGGSHGIY